MKSGGESLLDQIRKGVAQLYEYRYRYKGKLKPSPRLCLVVAEKPEDPPWLIDYLAAAR
jgi:hypothetical protein